MFDWEETVMSKTVKFVPLHDAGSCIDIRAELLEQAEISFTAGQESERAKVRGIYTDANDLKELEDRVKEYLEG